MKSEPMRRRLAAMTMRVAATHAGAPGAGITEGMEAAKDVLHDLVAKSRRPISDTERTHAHEAVDSMRQGRVLTEAQASAAEAIIMPDFRPAPRILNNAFPPFDDDVWKHLNDPASTKSILAAVPAVGRIEVPDHPSLPYAGTGFLVGEGLMMTNRHVAEIFVDGLGDTTLRFRSGLEDNGIDFRREDGISASEFFKIREVLMVHPYWDMALFRVEGLNPARKPLELGAVPPGDLLEQEIVVIGYPAQDPRNDLDVQRRVFDGPFQVKRLQPGLVKPVRSTKSFGHLVDAMTHDSSTLGGNSGSVVYHIASGKAVGLHFGGIYMDANFAVPAYELSRDPRVIAAGVNFTRTTSGDPPWKSYWIPRPEAAAATPAIPPQTRKDQAMSQQNSYTVNSDGSISFTVPLQITIQLGAAGGVPVAAVKQAAAAEEFPSQVPIIFDHLEERAGFDTAFLGDEVSLPEVTAKGAKITAKLDDGTDELKYHKFSVVMHGKRRLPLFTASNVDWRKERHMVNGKKPTRKQLTGLDDKAIEEWVTDPRIADDQQLDDVFYSKDSGAFDKGHVVRRDDVCWGDDFDDIQMANGDTYHVTNCTPQVKEFNRDTLGEFNWGDLEQLVQKQTKADLAILFAGPVMKNNDPIFSGKTAAGKVRVRVPMSFWKIIVVKGDSGALEAYGFVLEQDLSAVPLVVEGIVIPSEWKPFMKPIKEIEAMMNGLVKFPHLKPIDAFDNVEAVAVRQEMVK
ncbi:MAG: DNA/RNA non-specific endonuclease [Acidobacteria bacterium]|nr:DNA/RNA non-specific endonuclease [Acidobacteriota bacterium]